MQSIQNSALPAPADPAPKSGRARCGRAGEEGYVLIGVVFLAVMVLIALSIAAPKMAASIQRDREMELQHRAKQYTRALKLYYKRFGAYPPTLDALEKSNEIRFLRKRYKDPMTGKDDWHIIHFGEAKLPTAIGFFGQPIAGSTVAGIGPGAGASSGGLNGGGLNSGGLSNGGMTGASSTTSASGTDPNAQNGGTNGSTSGSAFGSSSSGSSSTGSSSFGSSSFGSSGNNQTFGGGGIIGIESTSPKQAILEYKKKKHFNEWEFVYDPNADLTTISSSGGIGGSTGNPPTSGISTPGTLTNQQPNVNVPTQQQQQQPSAPSTPAPQ